MHAARLSGVGWLRVARVGAQIQGRCAPNLYDYQVNYDNDTGGGLAVIAMAFVFVVMLVHDGEGGDEGEDG